MMSVSIECLGSGREFGDRLAADLRRARELRVAVAFAKESVLQRLDLETWVGEGGRLQLVAGTDFFLTELALFRRLGGRVDGRDLRVYHSPDGVTFHPKVYQLDTGDAQVAYVGSSNLTRGALTTNVEANVRLEGPPSSPELQRVSRLFFDWYESEFATTVQPEFAGHYDELQRLRRQAEGSGYGSHDWAAYQRAARTLLGEYRSLYAANRWFLVTTPTNYAVCMNTRTWGRQHEHEARAYRPGDLLVFHVTDGHGLRALGMFTGEAYYDDRPLWPANRRGGFPWRIRFEILGEVRAGLPTARLLRALRPGAPAHWFNGFVQRSHALERDDFEALRQALELAVAAGERAS